MSKGSRNLPLILMPATGKHRAACCIGEDATEATGDSVSVAVRDVLLYARVRDVRMCNADYPQTPEYLTRRCLVGCWWRGNEDGEVVGIVAVSARLDSTADKFLFLDASAYNFLS